MLPGADPGAKGITGKMSLAPKRSPVFTLSSHGWENLRPRSYSDIPKLTGQKVRGWPWSRPLLCTTPRKEGQQRRGR